MYQRVIILLVRVYDIVLVLVIQYVILLFLIHSNVDIFFIKKLCYFNVSVIIIYMAAPSKVKLLIVSGSRVKLAPKNHSVLPSTRIKKYAAAPR